MLGGLVFLAAVTFGIFTGSNATPLFIMSAPNPLRVGSPEKIFVEAQDYSGTDIAVTIKLIKYPTKDVEFRSTTVTLKTANKFSYSAELTTPVENFLETTKKHYMYLEADFRWQENGNPRTSKLTKVVLVSFKIGYIFIQTDKTLYTPQEEVKYRIFAMGPGMLPITESIIVEFQTPAGTTVEQKQVRADGTIPATFKLPEPVSLGRWKVVAKFQKDLHASSEYSASFEVKEYVLPTFEVKLETKPYFQVDMDKLEITIGARFLFDKPVYGVGVVVAGVIEGHSRTSLPESLHRVEITDGMGKTEVQRSFITQMYPDINTLVHKHLYITVTVFTDTGSDMVTSERIIPIVKSPYKIDLSKTPSYFKPGLPFPCRVHVTNPDGSPAARVLVEVKGFSHNAEAMTAPNGIATMPLNTVADPSKTEFSIEVKTKDSALKNSDQATKYKNIRPYRTKTDASNYLHISPTSSTVKVGDTLSFNLNLGQSPAASASRDITYLVLSKGRIVDTGKFRWDQQNLYAQSLTVSNEMLPSFRFVAYYHVGENEIVADSVWITVEDSCMETKPVIEITSSRRPKKGITFKIIGEGKTKVGLVAVDKGVYALNSKHRLTQPKIWDIVEGPDSGCTTGSGKDSMGVFYSAGLVFASKNPNLDNQEGTPERTEVGCSDSFRRRRDITDIRTTLANLFKGQDLERQCCMDGMRRNLLGYTCERRSAYVSDGQVCRAAFLRCCRDFSSKQKEVREEALVLARSENSKDDPEANISPRTFFPESWLWHDIILECPAENPKCEYIKTSTLPGSITSWEITAVSLSQTSGICVPDPFPVVVEKKFFVDLKLPYSVALNEQIEIKAIVHNYEEEQLRVRVSLSDTIHVCSAAFRKQKHTVYVLVESMSTRSVPFVIVPLKEGHHDITIKATAYDNDSEVRGTDGIMKTLNVASEGVPKTKFILNQELNPSKHGGSHRVRIDIPELTNRMPNTEAKVHIDITGEEMARTIFGAISGEPLGSLIKAPGGCGEQNMIAMTCPLIATLYLDKTDQWDKVGLERRSKAVEFIKEGYTQQLSFYKESDGSFVTFTPPEASPGSTWLTAYVMRIFLLAQKYIYVEENMLCKSAAFLLTRQNNGIFQEEANLYDSSIMGGIDNDETGSTLTAFVLIAMQQLPHATSCLQNDRRLQVSMLKAENFLEGQIHGLRSPYSVAITSYALANAGKLNKDILLRRSSGNTVWNTRNYYSTLEATSYALLALLKVGAIEEAEPVAKWLIQSGFTGRTGASSTQANIMMFQALTEFLSQQKPQEDINLNVDVIVQGRQRPIPFSFTRADYYHTRSDKVKLNELTTVHATGRGHASLLVTVEYFAMPVQKNEVCNNFDLNVEFTKNMASNEVTEEYTLTITYRFKGQRKAGMTIIDIGLLTGFEVSQEDLRELSTGKERYIQKFEMNKKLSTKGSLIIYLKEVSYNNTDKIVLKMYNELNALLIQPAAVTIYEYYVKESRCVKFYHISGSDSLGRLCHQDVCQCVQDVCASQRKGAINNDDRLVKVCEHLVHYAYEATVLNITEEPHANNYQMEIKTVKEGSDVFQGTVQRQFLAHPSCKDFLDLKSGSSYLIMGFIDITLLDNGEQVYTLDKDTWIEYIPTPAECLTDQYRARCKDQLDFKAEFIAKGCKQ